MPPVKESQRRLDPAKVVDSALRIADAEGLEAVTLRRLAQLHEVTPMALYRHFSDKSDLLNAMADRLLADIELPPPTDQRWDEQLRAVLAAFVAALRPHPNAAGLTLTRLLIAEPGLAMAERAMELLTSAGLTPETAAEIGRQSICSLVTLVAMDPAGGTAVDRAEREQVLREKRAALSTIDPERYPLITGAAEALVRPTWSDETYGTGIDLVVAGVRGLLTERKS